MTWTREQVNQYRADWYHRRRSEFFAGKVCCTCGTEEGLRLRYSGPGRLDLSSLWSWNRHRREEVLAQCRVMCRTCWSRSYRVHPAPKYSKYLLHKQWMRNWRRYRWILLKRGVSVPVAAPREDYVQMVLEVIATL